MNKRVVGDAYSTKNDINKRGNVADLPSLPEQLLAIRAGDAVTVPAAVTQPTTTAAGVAVPAKRVDDELTSGVANSSDDRDVGALHGAAAAVAATTTTTAAIVVVVVVVVVVVANVVVVGVVRSVKVVVCARPTFGNSATSKTANITSRKLRRPTETNTIGPIIVWKAVIHFIRLSVCPLFVWS